MFLIGAAFRNGTTHCTIESIARDTKIPGLTLGPMIAALEAAGLISASEGEGLLPGREMSRITLAEILAAVRSGGDTGSLVPPTWSAPVNAIAERLHATIQDLTAGITLSALLDQADTPPHSATDGTP
jgi:DNA-binding IscR family transcriptional regulator